ncbi:MAG: PspC domain-containing protein [Nocardioides sp.]
MSTSPPEAPVEPEPRVSRDEIRDLGRLRRTRHDRKVAGVAGGLARHFDIDPIIPRVALVVLVFFGGAGLLIYGVCWLIVPSEDNDEATVRLDERSRTVALVIVGILSALALLGDSLGGWDFPWPLVIIGAIVLGVMAFRHRNDRTTSQVPPPGTEAAPVFEAPAPQQRRGGPVLFWYVLLLIAIGCGVLGMIELAGADIADGAYPALALATCGVMLTVGAFWGRAGGIIALGLVSALATAGATVMHDVETGHIDARPVTASAVEDEYTLGMGEIELDLTRIADLDNLDGRTIEIDLGLGRIAVIVPQGIDVRVEGGLDIGHREVFGDDQGREGTNTVDGGPQAPVLELEVELGIGEIQIDREGDN